MSEFSLSCLAGLDEIQPLVLSDSCLLSNTSSPSQPYQLPLFSTFLGSFTSSPYLLLSSAGPAVSRENMSSPLSLRHRRVCKTQTISSPSKPRLSSPRSKRTRRPEQQQSVVHPSSSPAPPLEILPPLPSIPALTLPHFSHYNENMTPRTIPKLQHPNSPYVPWSLPTRREIISPSNTSGLDHCYSRSGARAPEPTSLSGKSPKTKLGKLCNRVKTIASRFIPGSKCGDVLIHRHPDVDSESELYTPTPQRDTFFDPTFSDSSHSTGSTESFESTSLQLWLAMRMQQNDAPCEKVGMTLEEYDRRGSWLRVHSKRSLATTLTTNTTGCKQRSSFHCSPSPLSTCATVSYACADTGHD